MTIRLTLLSRLIAKIVGSVGCQLGLRTMSACAIATVLSGQVHGQLIDGLVYSDDGAIGTAALASSDQQDGSSEVGQYGEGGLYVGPGGPTSIANVPSAMGPSPTSGRTRLVNQPFPTGPFMQNQPVYQDNGSAIPCPCDEGCDFSYYGQAEALYFRRDYDERFSLSQNFGIPPFDYEWAGRITVGRVTDCVNGYEFVYAGPFKWQRDSSVTSLGGNLQSRLVPTGFLPAAVSAFNDASNHTQTYQARMNTYEFNRRWWAWDIFSTLIGMRVVDYREYYGFSSTGAGGTGIYEDFTRNRMIGPQVGGELMQPFGLRTLLGFRGKGALLANFSRNQLALQNAGLNVLGVTDSDVEVAGMFEVGSYIKYSLTPSIRLTGGYEFWYLPSVATVSGQSLNIVSPGTGSRVNADDDLLLHGASFGAQILF